MKTQLLRFAVLSTFSFQLSALGQGSLTPPGAPAPTMKRLDQIEPRTPISFVPFTITNSGSYYLTTNLVAGTGRGGLVIQADAVTVDLNGFALLTTQSLSNGVYVAAPQNNLCVRNGTIQGWGLNGIDAAQASHCRFENLRCYGNQQNGIQAGDGCVFTACVVASNSAGAGLVAGQSAVISQCVARNNGGNGISAGGLAHVVECSAENNAGTGIAVNDGSTVSGCSSLYNLGGISAGTGSTLTQSAARANQSDGFSCSQSLITDCTAQGNGGRGIVASDGSAVIHCVARINTQHGIQIAYSSRALDNTCDLNGYLTGVGSGVRVIDAKNRVEGNTVTSNDKGIEVINAGNLIFRNSASGNTNDFDIVTGNSVGQIYNVSGASTVTITNNNPWANFVY